VGLAATLEGLWNEHSGEIDHRISTLDAAADGARAGGVDPELLDRARRAAHQLKGSVGTFGFERASGLAGKIEEALRADPVPGDRLATLIEALREALPAPDPATEAPAARPVVAPSATVLTVDDDALVRRTLESVLGAEGWRVVTRATGDELLEVLAETLPDLVVLDVDMPGRGGLELCRALRADPRWAVLPVLVLTGRTDLETVRGAFEAGADDFVAKPIVGPEVVARIANRLERTRLLRALAETDHLTGLVNRGAAEAAIERLLRLAHRHRQPLALAVVDIDRFKAINDSEGHAAGDVALRGVADALRSAFRGEDVVCRWGGDEFVVALYATGAADARGRVAAALGRAPVACSGGIAATPDAGTELASLYDAADAALYAVKRGGRGGVALAG
jgi:diguanylate cyclase (GGDEF)-like protein